MDYKLPSGSKVEQIATLKAQVVMFSVLQYVMPLIMLGLAYALPYMHVPPDSAKIATAVLCIFALMDFALLRFVVLRQAIQKLAELEGGPSSDSGL